MNAWLTVKEAAARLQCSAAFIYLNIKQGRLRASRLGFRHHLRIHEDWLDAWVVSLSTPHEITPAETHGRKRAH